ncbi:hypothetical protein F5Y11DRAFT_189651 [Daldinia sp. FL1419]|nr:hypothetical protein F5Y11DRAFT_189651 [Daldinia sp. FL1419]
MALAQDRVLKLTELLENIISGLDNREILLTAQLVCRRWKELIATSPKIQAVLFFRESSKPLTRLIYAKNTIIAYVFPAFFNTAFYNGGSYCHHLKFSKISLDEICTYLYDSSVRGIWLNENASWRRMLVSQPPITAIHWHVSREDQDDPRVSLPGTIAEFKFPDGLRMGDFYDLILGTRCDHEITWPTLDDDASRIRLVDVADEDPRQWKYDQLWKAYVERAILIRQRVFEEDPKPFRSRDIFWSPSDLHKYRENLLAVKTRVVKVVGGNVSWSYETRAADMDIFLHAAQDPVLPET